MVLDVPPDIQRWYQEMVGSGMAEEHARAIVQDHLQQMQQRPQVLETAPWQQFRHASDGPHNYMHEAHMHRPETREIANEFWRAHGNPQRMTDEQVFRFNKYLVNEGFGHDAFQIHKKVPFEQQDLAIESLTRPFEPPRHLNFVPAHMLRISENMKPVNDQKLQELANYMSRLGYRRDEIQFRLASELEDVNRRMQGGPPGAL